MLFNVKPEVESAEKEENNNHNNNQESAQECDVFHTPASVTAAENSAFYSQFT